MYSISQVRIAVCAITKQHVLVDTETPDGGWIANCEFLHTVPRVVLQCPLCCQDYDWYRS